MEIRLKAGAGFPNRLLYTLAVIAGVSVANLYYNQPLLDMIRQEMGTTTLAANHIALFSQCGYALGLLFLIPLADLRSRRRILLVDFTLLILALLATATAPDIGVLHVSSFVIGVCSVVPQFFIPFAAQYSRPENKNRNVGIILSGLLTGILASRVVSGAIGEWLGWREMYCIATGMMLVCAVLVFRILPDEKPNFTGSYAALMRSLFTLLKQYPLLRLHSVRTALAFGSFMGFWATLAFKMAQEPFHAGSDVVGMLGLCGIAGAVTASFIGKYIAWLGVYRFNCFGALLQLAAWGLFAAGGDHYGPIIGGILLVDIGMQCIQLSNQAPLFELCPSAANRINTIFMSCYFIGGSLGTLLSGTAWVLFGWSGVVGTGALLTALSLIITLVAKR